MLSFCKDYFILEMIPKILKLNNENSRNHIINKLQTKVTKISNKIIMMKTQLENYYNNQWSKKKE